MSKLKVLYLDDDPPNLTLFGHMFRRDFDVITKPNGDEALAYLDHDHVDLIVTDHRMPGMSGLEFLDLVTKKFKSHLPGRILVSGYTENDFSDAMEDQILDAYISKQTYTRR